MLENQENMKNKSLRAQILKNNKDRKKEMAPNERIIEVLKLVLEYLSPSDKPVKLLRVSKYWRA